MNPLVLIVPTVILMAGGVSYVLLPLPLPVRLAVLITDAIAAGLIGFVLYRRLK